MPARNAVRNDLKATVERISEQLEVIARLDSDYMPLLPNHEALVERLIEDSVDDESKAMWDLTRELFGLYRRSAQVDDYTLLEEISSFTHGIAARAATILTISPEKMLRRTAEACLVFAEGWVRGAKEAKGSDLNLHR